MPTQLHQEGLQFLLEVAFSEQQAPLGAGAFYLGLCTDTLLADNATLASKTEVSGTGYARQAAASSAVGFTSAAVSTNAWKQTTLTVTFTAGGTWTGAKTVFLATSVDDTGKLIASAPLSATRTLDNGDTLSVALQMTLTAS
jgi:hypothetical protein